MAHSPDDKSSPIDPNDFKSIELKISILNTTTQTQIKDGRRIYGDREQKSDAERETIRLLEFLEEGVAVEVPPHSGAQGHSLMIQISTVNAPENVDFVASADIINAERLDNQKYRFDLRFNHYDKSTFEALTKIYSSRQQAILEFFQAVKGY